MENSHTTTLPGAINEEPEENYYKVIKEDGQSFGRYIGATPKHAACKAFTKISSGIIKKGETIPEKMTITLRVCKRGCSSPEIHKFEAIRDESGFHPTLRIPDDKN